MKDDLKAALCALADEVRASDTRIADLERFLTQVEETDAFFADAELEATRECIRTEREQREKKAQMLREKVEIYEDRVLRLYETLDQRKRVFDDHPDSLRGAPELLSLFVDRHAAISAELDAARQFLMNE